MTCPKCRGVMYYDGDFRAPAFWCRFCGKGVFVNKHGKPIIPFGYSPMTSNLRYRKLRYEIDGIENKREPLLGYVHHPPRER